MRNNHDRRAHAEALQSRNRAHSADRFRRHARTLALSTALGALAMGWFKVPLPEFGYAARYAQVRFDAWIFEGQPIDPQIAMTINGQPYRWGAKEWANWQPLGATASDVASRVGEGAFGGFVLGLAGLGIGTWTRRRKREALLADRVITGTHVVGEKVLARLAVAKGGNRAGLAIGPVPLPPKLETRHMALIATTGAGKTTVLRQLLDCAEVRGEAALVWDTSGEFVAHYYNPARGDVILNPFDERGHYWNPFDEIEHPADAERIARYLVPETGAKERDVWLETARGLTANIMRALWRDGKGTPEALLDALQAMPRDEIAAMVENTASARTFEEDADRATASVIFMLARAASLMAFLRASPDDGGEGFSFRRFFAEHDAMPGAKPWIFVPRREAYFEATKPLLALWLECAASAMLGLAKSDTRRVWFMLDELADLPQTSNLARVLPEGRKNGASVVITFQAITQMFDRYGEHRAEAMLGMCNTKLFMQMADHLTRQWASEQIGAQEVEIQTISDALDPKTGQPTRTLSTTRQTRPAVLESELRLPSYTGYLLLPDGMPVARITLGDAHIKARGPARHPAYLAADVSQTLWGRLSEKTKTEARGNAADAPFPTPPSQGPV